VPTQMHNPFFKHRDWPPVSEHVKKHSIMSKLDFKKEIESFDKKQLVKLIMDLYNKNSSAKEYLDFLFNSNDEEVLNIYKQKVREAFYPKRGFELKISIGKKAISDYRKLNPSPDSLIDLLLWYVESGADFTNDYGDIDERFYLSIEGVYDNALKFIDKVGLHLKYQDRAFQITKKTENIGWGFHDTLCDCYYDIYE